MLSNIRIFEGVGEMLSVWSRSRVVKASSLGSKGPELDSPFEVFGDENRLPLIIPWASSLCRCFVRKVGSLLKTVYFEL